MIDPAQIRIGNWLNRKPVKGIPPIKITRELFTFMLKEQWYLESFEYIPVDKSWLDKFGFKEQNDQYENIFYSNDYYKISMNNSNTRFYFGLDYEDYHTPIDYVHELQNIYWVLTGSELLTLEEQKND